MFVNVGYSKDGFLHYHDLGPQVLFQEIHKKVGTGKHKDFALKNFDFENDINKNGKIDDILKSNEQTLVQIVKEPISTKGQG